MAVLFERLGGLVTKIVEGIGQQSFPRLSLECVICFGTSWNVEVCSSCCRLRSSRGRVAAQSNCGLGAVSQVVLVSATLPHDVLEMTHKFMTHPLRVLVKRDELTLEVCHAWASKKWFRHDFVVK